MSRSFAMKFRTVVRIVVALTARTVWIRVGGASAQPSVSSRGNRKSRTVIDSPPPVVFLENAATGKQRVTIAGFPNTTSRPWRPKCLERVTRRRRPYGVCLRVRWFSFCKRYAIVEIPGVYRGRVSAIRVIRGASTDPGTRRAREYCGSG